MKYSMNKTERITARTVNLSVISSVVLGLVSLLVGLSIFSNSLMKDSVSRTRTTTSKAASSAEHIADIAGFAEDVMQLYESLTPAQRALTGTEEYRQYFQGLDSVSRQGQVYETLVNMLRSYVVDVSRLYICAFDAERGVLVYLADSEGISPRYPGEWEAESDEWIKELSDFSVYGRNGENTPYDFRHTEGKGSKCIAACPIRDENDRKCAFLVAELYIDSVFTDIVQYALKVSAAVLTLTLMIALFVGNLMKKMVADPINAIARTAMTYVQDRKNGVARSDHFSSLGIRTGDELENLTNVMADMEHELIEHEEQIARITAENERIRVELEMASKIQSSALPGVFPPFPDRTDFELYASMVPAKEVGGDFYDFFLIDDDHLALVIADVSGKGVPAALFMMVAKSLIKNQLLSGCDPAGTLGRANLQLCDGNTSKTFVTVWVAVLELSTGKGIVCNAGHEKPALCRSGGKYELLAYKHDMFVGVRKKAQFHAHEFEMNPGDCLFVYTDGVPEATNSRSDMFGEERLVETLNHNQDAKPEEQIRRVHEAVAVFVENAPQFDDITMLCLRYNGKEGRDNKI